MSSTAREAGEADPLEGLTGEERRRERHRLNAAKKRLAKKAQEDAMSPRKKARAQRERKDAQNVEALM